MNSKSALVFGATGLVGSHCASQLLASNDYSSIVVFTRSPLPLSHPKLTKHLIDFNKLDDSLIRGDDLFCCLGTTMRKAGSPEAFEKVDFTYPLEIARAASASGVKQFLLVTSVGSDPSSANFYLKTKGRVEEAIKPLRFQSLLIFRPSFLMGNREEFRLGERIGITTMRALTAAPIDALKKYRPIAASIVASAMIAAAQHGQEGIRVFESDEIQSLGSL
ncbi:MAG: oxidoreductase [Ignavibacteriae bacterium]|nr:oxidoreductase [Ignavibacteriota bacterium]